MVTIKVREIKFDPGFWGLNASGHSHSVGDYSIRELGRLEIGVQVLNQGNEKLNVQEAHAVLQRFSQQFSKALTQPLAFD